MASAANTDGWRYVMPDTSNPSRTRDVTPASAASVVLPSKHSPGPSPYIGWKWSKPHTPSNPSSSASCARATTSANGMRCCATSSPNLTGSEATRRGEASAGDDRPELWLLAAERAPRALPPGDDPRVDH